MAYLRNEPVGTDDLTVSQPKLATNTNQADDSFGVDHYKFSDTTPNNGFHNQVTTPVYVATPATGLPPVTVANPIFYAFQDSANVGVIQYSRGPNAPVPTPLTTLQSTAAAINIGAGGTTNVLNFNGLAFATALLSATDSTNSECCYSFILWNGSSLTIKETFSTTNIFSQASGTTLQVKVNNAQPTVRWTLQLLRTS